MNALFLILSLVFLVACIVCAAKESRLTGTYKAAGVYGRIKAYLALDFTFAGAAMFIMGFASLFSAEGRAQGIGSLLGFMVFGLVLAALGVFLYAAAYHKCPRRLKKKCIPSMIMSGLGITIKIVLFFIPAVWALSGGSTTSSSTYEEDDEGEQVEVWRENGMMRENLKVNSSGDMYFDPDDQQWHKIKR